MEKKGGTHDESRKLAIAKYFYGQLLVAQQSQEDFAFSLSAFLTAARSVLRYEWEEATSKSGGLSWYDGAMAASPTIRFLKSSRDLSVHTEPVVPQSEIGSREAAHSGLDEAMEVNIFKDRRLVEHHPSETATESAGDVPPSVGYLHYRFTDWRGSEDATGLCNAYT